MNVSTAELRSRVKQQIERLSPERLAVALDFLTYLEERESDEATEELLKLPGFLDALERAKREINQGDLTDVNELQRKA